MFNVRGVKNKNKKLMLISTNKEDTMEKLMKKLITAKGVRQKD